MFTLDQFRVFSPQGPGIQPLRMRDVQTPVHLPSRTCGRCRQQHRSGFTSRLQSIRNRASSILRMGQSSRFPLAVHVLVALSFRPKDFISSDSLSGTVHTNPVVVRRIVASLRRAGFVVSQSGVAGGVRLAKPARQISLLDVYRAVGRGELFRMHKPNRACPIGKGIPGALAEFLPKAERAFEQSLSDVTVEDVAKKTWPAFFEAKQ